MTLDELNKLTEGATEDCPRSDDLVVYATLAAIDAPQLSESEAGSITMDDPPDHQIDEMLLKEPDE